MLHSSTPLPQLPGMGFPSTTGSGACKGFRTGFQKVLERKDTGTLPATIRTSGKSTGSAPKWAPGIWTGLPRVRSRSSRASTQPELNAAAAAFSLQQALHSVCHEGLTDRRPIKLVNVSATWPVCLLRPTIHVSHDSRSFDRPPLPCPPLSFRLASEKNLREGGAHSDASSLARSM